MDVDDVARDRAVGIFANDAPSDSLRRRLNDGSLIIYTYVTIYNMTPIIRCLLSHGELYTLKNTTRHGKKGLRARLLASCKWA